MEGICKEEKIISDKHSRRKPPRGTSTEPHHSGGHETTSRAGVEGQDKLSAVYMKGKR